MNLMGSCEAVGKGASYISMPLHIVDIFSKNNI